VPLRVWLIAVYMGFGFSTLAAPVYAQTERLAPVVLLEEIIVTATRVESNLQQTPLSVQAFTTEDLELGGIDSGRELGIMVPNVVLNSGGVGERNPTMIIRGLPGVGIYLDGVWQAGAGFLQTNFVELERIEVLRGPQGTLFGRNTNGGAVQLITRLPAEDFGARASLELGEFNRRDFTLAVDLPISDRLKTKWMAASLQNDGFLESLSVPRALGDQDDQLLRADILWTPTDCFSLRFTANEESRTSSDARIVRISDPTNFHYIAYNVLAGNPDFIDQARAIDPMFPDPPSALTGTRFTAETHETNFPGGELDKWQTKSDTLDPSTVIDGRNYTLTLNWDITDNLSLESLSSNTERNTKQITDFDSSEFTITTDSRLSFVEGFTQELHFTGNHFDDRLQWLLGLYYLKQKGKFRFMRWPLWEFAIPNTGPNPALPGPPGVGGRPEWNIAAVDYVRSWGATVGNNSLANFSPLTWLTADGLNRGQDLDRAFFGELTIGLIDKLDLTLGFRVTEDDGWVAQLIPTDAFRTLEPAGQPVGDLYAGNVISREDDPDLDTISTPKVSISYQPTEDIYLYASYAEGFTSGGVVESRFVADPIILDPEVVKTREIGLRSDWLNGRLRLNATYFDSDWDGLRVRAQLSDPSNPGQFLPFSIPSSDGLAAVSGLEAELVYLPAPRWELDFALGLLDAEYLDIGDPPANGTGLQPGIPFAYAPETSYSLGVRYRLPLVSGGQMLLVGNYGWMDEYQRHESNQNQTKNADGSNKPEPAYGLLNARIVYEPAARNWRLSLFGTNLTDEWYVNGGFEAADTWGYDFATIGRPREVGIGLQFFLD